MADNGHSTFHDQFIDFRELAQDRWRVSWKTIARLTEKGTLPKPVELPGRRGRFFRRADIEKLERELSNTKEQILTAEENQKRVCDAWAAFDRHVSPLHQYRDAMRIALSHRVESDPMFGLGENDVAAFVEVKTAEYNEVRRAFAEREKRENAAPELRKMVESRPGAMPSCGPADELVAMCGSEKHQGRAR